MSLFNIIRNAVPRRYLVIAIYVVLVAILFEVIGIATARADGFGIPRLEDSPYTIENSEHALQNSPYLMKNSQYHPNNSRYGGGSNKIRDNTGNVIGYSVERDDGGVNYFGYGDEGRIGYQPAP
jgi:hypothetical protein